MDHCLVATISKLNSAPMGFVKQGLPNFVRGVGLTVHDTTVAKDHSSDFTLECCFKENIFQGHLRLHDLNLEAHLVHKCHLMRLDKASAFHHQGRSLRNDQHLEAFLRQLICDSRQCSGLAGARTSC